jgi:hypothetical protein
MHIEKVLMKMATGLHTLLCTLPLLCVMNLYAMAGRAAVLLGHGPPYNYNNESVDHVGSDDWLYRLLSDGMDWLVGAVILSLPFWLLFTFCLRGRYSFGGRWGRFALYSLGWLAWVAVAVFDPGGCFKWFMD